MLKREQLPNNMHCKTPVGPQKFICIQTAVGGFELGLLVYYRGSSANERRVQLRLLCCSYASILVGLPLPIFKASHITCPYCGQFL